MMALQDSRVVRCWEYCDTNDAKQKLLPDP